MLTFQYAEVRDASLYIEPGIDQEEWLSIGMQLGAVERTNRWLIGDWLMFGESAFEIKQMYGVAAEVTGLTHGTLMNVRSICARVASDRRVSALTFSHHAEVASLDPESQTYYLGLAISNAWTQRELRNAIRGNVRPLSNMDRNDRISEAARLLLANAKRKRSKYVVDHSYVVLLADAVGVPAGELFVAA